MDIDVARRRKIRRPSCFFLCVATGVALAPSARAQSASPEDIASARALGTEGVRLAESGDCAAAVPKLEAAEKLYHAPTTLERLGECEVNLGHLVGGTEILNRVVREPLAANAPAAFVAAQERATQLLATAQPRIGKLRIHVEGAPVDRVAVTVDGVSVPSALFDADRATDPGTHEVRATAPGYKTAVATVELQGGSAGAVSLKLEVDPNAPIAPAGAPGAAATATGGSAGASTPAPTGSAPNRLPAWIALSVGGAGIAVGSVFGILALGSKSSLDNACVNKICPASSQSDIDAMSTRATISNVGFAVGVIGAGVGTALLLLSPASEARPAASSRSRPSVVRVKPWLGMAAMGLGGTFE